ncbi:hypothetical protein [Paraburkholderia hayleyella]|uniref:hypothetical protein n=1 Tax=Paraburkholderia hayleyella TaxID=2152889 RepID=UPI001291BEA6|nr:hypothetical protein [Paraburkholderia hayleyella]
MQTFSAFVGGELICLIEKKFGQKSPDLIKKNTLYVLKCIYEYCDDVHLSLMGCLTKGAGIQDLNEIFFSAPRSGENHKGKLTVDIIHKWGDEEFNFNDEIAYSSISVIDRGFLCGNNNIPCDYLNWKKLQEFQFSQKTDSVIFARLGENSSIKKGGRQVFPGNERLAEDLLGQVKHSNIEVLSLKTNQDFTKNLNLTVLSSVTALDLEIKNVNFSVFLDSALENMNIKIIRLKYFGFFSVIKIYDRILKNSDSDAATLEESRVSDRDVLEKIENLAKSAFQKALDDSKFREVPTFLSSAEVLKEFPDLKSCEDMLSSIKMR